METKAHSSPGVKIPPPIFYLIALLIGIGLNYVWPVAPVPKAWGYVIGAIIIVVCVVIMPLVLIRFKRSKTTFDVRKSATVLITEGPYRFSRNPAYVSLTLLCIGIGFAVNNGWIWVMCVPAILVTDLWIIRKEEQHLEVQFGEKFLKYKSTVRRWI